MKKNLRFALVYLILSLTSSIVASGGSDIAAPRQDASVAVRAGMSKASNPRNVIARAAQAASTPAIITSPAIPC